ncbi:MAG: hypothetical protein R2695_20280 [Acidimicrobiales bacterium]
MEDLGLTPGETRIVHQDVVGNYLDIRYGDAGAAWIDDRFELHDPSLVEDYLILLDGRPEWPCGREVRRRGDPVAHRASAHGAGGAFGRVDNRVGRRRLDGVVRRRAPGLLRPPNRQRRRGEVLSRMAAPADGKAAHDQSHIATGVDVNLINELETPSRASSADAERLRRPSPHRASSWMRPLARVGRASDGYEIPGPGPGMPDRVDRVAAFAPAILAIRWGMTAVSLALSGSGFVSSDWEIVLWCIALVSYTVIRTVSPLRYTGDVRSLAAVIFEIALHVVAVAATDYWQSPFVFSLMTAIIVAGFARGFGVRPSDRVQRRSPSRSVTPPG